LVTSLNLASVLAGGVIFVRVQNDSNSTSLPHTSPTSMRFNNQTTFNLHTTELQTLVKYQLRKMCRINYLVLGSGRIGVLRMPLSTEVQAVIDAVYDRHLFDCKPGDLEAYRVDVPVTKAGIPPEYTPVSFGVFLMVL